MYSVLIVIIVILSLLLSFLVTIQNSKGGGLAAGFSSSNQIMGVRKTTDFLEKSTWTIMGCIVVLSIATAFVGRPKVYDEGSVMMNEATDQIMVNPTQTPGYDVPSADEIPTLPEQGN